MLEANSAIYLGKDFEDGYIGYFTTEHLFLVLAIEEGITHEEGDDLLQNMKAHLVRAHLHNLAKFESTISDLILKLNIPASFSLSAGLLHDNVLYVKTAGKGQVYMRRGNNLAKLLSGDNSASGYLKQFDCMVFTTSKLHGVLGDLEDIKVFMDLNTPEDIVENMKVQQYDEEDRGVIALFVEVALPKKEVPQELDLDSVYDSEDEVDHIEDEPNEYEKERELEKHIRSDYHPPPQNLFMSKIAGLKEQVSHLNLKTPAQFKKSKKLTMIIVAVIFVVLVWSVVFGYQRRAAAELDKKVQTTKDLVNQKITDAEGVSFLDIERSMALLAEARTEIDKLKQEVGSKKAEEITELETMIKEKETQIVKKEEKQYTEFYDLALENKDAQGSTMALEGENVAILDEKKGRVYVLSMTKKSLEKRTATQASTSRLVSMYKDKVYMFGGNGVSEFTGIDKAKEAIPYDPEWGEITGIAMYGGNIYMLDKEKGDVYKYVVTAKGFSEKSSYFQSEQSDLNNATSIAIDSSVYIANGNTVIKYTRGAKDEFKTAFPTADVSITKIYTSAEVEKVFAWDKKKGLIYILNKNGAYERQLKSELLTKSQDFFIYKNAAYILSGQKIYKMDL